MDKYKRSNVQMKACVTFTFSVFPSVGHKKLHRLNQGLKSGRIEQVNYKWGPNRIVKLNFNSKLFLISLKGRFKVQKCMFNLYHLTAKPTCFKTGNKEILLLLLWGYQKLHYLLCLDPNKVLALDSYSNPGFGDILMTPQEQHEGSIVADLSARVFTSGAPKAIKNLS